MPLDIRRRRLSAQYCLNVTSNTTNPARSCISNNRFAKLFQTTKSGKENICSKTKAKTQPLGGGNDDS